MERLTEGTRVRIDIPDESDPDHDQYHGVHGEVIKTIEDDAGKLAGDREDGVIYRIRLESGATSDFRQADLRPSFD